MRHLPAATVSLQVPDDLLHSPTTQERLLWQSESVVQVVGPVPLVSVPLFPTVMSPHAVNAPKIIQRIESRRNVIFPPNAADVVDYVKLVSALCDLERSHAHLKMYGNDPHKSSAYGDRERKHERITI